VTTQLVIAALVMLAVLGTVAAVAAGFGDSLAPAWRDTAPLPLPAGRQLTADDLASTRFAIAFRGYRMAEVDLVLDRLTSELADRDDELGRLRSLAAGPVGPAGSTVPEPVGDPLPSIGEPAPDPPGRPPSPPGEPGPLPDPDQPVVPGRPDPAPPDTGQPRPGHVDRP
jgi:DivIVA domain-containing protein